jgi:predicted permease
MGGIMVVPPRRAIDLWRQSAHVFDSVISYSGQSHVLASDGVPQEVEVTYIGAETLPFFGVAPAVGRAIDAGDESPAAPRAILISDTLWRQRFNGDRSVIGRPIALGDASFVIVGVMPPRFALPMGSDDMWAARRPSDPDTGYNTIARLKPGVSAEQAQAELARLAEITSADPELRGWRGKLMRPADMLGTNLSRALEVLMAAVGVLLLIACANIASLVLSRNAMRRRELTLRSALGASRPRLVRQLLVEGTVLAVVGGAAGLLFANWGLAALNAIRPRNLSALERVTLDGSVLGFALTLSVVCGLLFSMLPALRASKTSLADVLRSTGRLTSVGAQRFRRTLVVAQVALACVLLVGAALLGRSLQQMMTVDLGFKPEGLVAMRVSLPASRYPSADYRRRLFDEVHEKVERLPGVTRAAAGNGLPPEGGVMFGELEIEGRKKTASSLFSGGYVTPGYFATLEIPIVAGRVFTQNDISSSAPVVVVSESFVKKHFQDQSPLGSRMRISTRSPYAVIVGVVGDVRANSVTDAGSLQLYYPRAQVGAGFGAIIARAPGADPRMLADQMRRAVWSVDPRLPIPDVLTSAQVLLRSTDQSRFTTVLLITFAISGLVLALVGVYGVLMLYVGDRRYEFGIRLALGAPRSAVAQAVMRQSLVLLGGGAVVGLAAAVPLSGYLRALLFQVRPSDPWLLGVAVGTVIVTGALAVWGPLRRALGLDPATVLRSS